MTQAPDISIVIPVYNGLPHLRTCLDSLQAQTHTNFEVLIRDDGSRDGSTELIARYSADPRIRVLPGGHNLGLFPNTNTLIREIRAPLVRVLCQDDMLEPACLATEVAFFAQHPEIGMAYGKVLSIDATGKPLGYWPVEGHPAVMPPAMSMQLFYYYGCIVGNLSNACMRRTVIDELGLFDENYPVAGDYEMWVRICMRYPLGVIHEPILRVRSHIGQLSRTVVSSVAAIRETRQIRDIILPTLPTLIQSYARQYSRMRHGVLDMHYAFRRLLVGDMRTFMAILHCLGLSDTVSGSFFWLVTVDNHLFSPKPRFVHVPSESDDVAY
ncbi:MAG: glycosyltransferase family 2 protein [Oscillochloridaceae bacterium umkhey_bin13]